MPLGILQTVRLQINTSANWLRHKETGEGKVKYSLLRDVKRT